MDFDEFTSGMQRFRGNSKLKDARYCDHDCIYEDSVLPITDRSQLLGQYLLTND